MRLLRNIPVMGKLMAIVVVAVLGVVITAWAQLSALYPDLLPPTPGTPDAVDAADLARVALARLAVGGEGLVLPTEPLYLRRPDAVPPAAAKRARA